MCRVPGNFRRGRSVLHKISDIKISLISNLTQYCYPDPDPNPHQPVRHRTGSGAEVASWPEPSSLARGNRSGCAMSRTQAVAADPRRAARLRLGLNRAANDHNPRHVLPARVRAACQSPAYSSWHGRVAP